MNRDAAKFCERCGGVLSKGSVKAYTSGGDTFRSPVAHAESERHLRQIAITARVLEGYAPIAGTTSGMSYSGDYNCAFWLMCWYKQHGSKTTRCSWIQTGKNSIPGLPFHAAWIQIDAVEEILGDLREFATLTDQAVRRAGSELWTDPRNAYKFSMVNEAVEAARNVQNHGVPWWAAIREGAHHGSIPRWILS